MRFFGKTKRPRARKRPKSVKEILNDAYLTELRKDPELKREIALREAGHADVLDRDKESESSKRQIKQFVIAEALNKIKSDPELAEQFIESQVEEILTGGKLGRRRHQGDQPEYYGEPAGSSISQALGELDSLLELKTRLTELGETNGGEVSKGFFGGLQLKDLLAILPQIIPYLASGQKGATQQQEPMYVVQVDGAPTQVTESQYHQLLQEGRIKPMAILAPPQKPEVKPEPKVITEAEEHQQPQSDLPTLDFILERVTFGDLLHCMSGDPDELVMLLYDGKESGSEWAQYVWGMLANSDYESLMAMAQHYSADDRATEFIELLMSDSSREWIENVIDRIKSM